MDRADFLLVSLIACALALAGEAGADAQMRPVVEEGSTTLWLWFGRHDLRGLHAATNGQVSVAYHARTLRLEGASLVVQPRRGAIYLDPETPRTAVVHIEVGRQTRAADFHSSQEAILGAIDPIWREPRVMTLQIDFDAPASFRPVYAELLRVLRARLPAGWRLEMTALGSWCAQDRWLENVPVDSIVPMLFGPGHEQADILAALRRGPLPEARCRDSHGIREGTVSPSRPRRLFVFPTAPWTLARAVEAWEGAQPDSTN